MPLERNEKTCLQVDGEEEWWRILSKDWISENMRRNMVLGVWTYDESKLKISLVWQTCEGNLGTSRAHKPVKVPDSNAAYLAIYIACVYTWHAPLTQGTAILRGDSGTLKVRQRSVSRWLLMFHHLHGRHRLNDVSFCGSVAQWGRRRRWHPGLVISVLLQCEKVQCSLPSVFCCGGGLRGDIGISTLHPFFNVITTLRKYHVHRPHNERKRSDPSDLNIQFSVRVSTAIRLLWAMRDSNAIFYSQDDHKNIMGPQIIPRDLGVSLRKSEPDVAKRETFQ